MFSIDGALEFMGGKSAGLIITAGLLGSGATWAGITFLKKSRTEEEEKYADIAFIVMAIFLALFFAKVFLAPNIGDMARESIAQRVVGAAQAVAQAQSASAKAKQLANSAAAAVELQTRIFFGTTPMEITYALTTAVGVGLLYTKRKKEDQTDGDKAAAFFLILLLAFMVGVQYKKDSEGEAIRNAQLAANKAMRKTLNPNNTA